MSCAPVRCEMDGDVAVILFDNPERLNPFTQVLQETLLTLLARLRENRSVRAVVLAAQGRAFSAGADLAALGAPASGDSRPLGERTAEWIRNLTNPLVLALHDMPVPVISAVNGACAGGGVGLALAADMVLVGRSAYFYLPFVTKLGIVPDVGASWFVQRLAGRSRALGLTLTGDRLTAERAVNWGLAWECVDDDKLRAHAIALAHRLAKLPAFGAFEARRAFDAAATNSLQDQLEYEAQRQCVLLDQPSFQEGVNAFFGKREARFPGR